VTSKRPAFRLALAGDAIVNRRISTCNDPRVLEIFALFQQSDLGFINCETLFHDYSGPELYPAAESGWTYMRAPPEVADDLRWMGIKLMSVANNHTLDYSYGGLFSTLAALKKAGIENAGAGRNLEEARAAAYVDTGTARVSLVSMTTSFTRWSRAGSPYDGIPGRPGINPLGFHFAADKDTLARFIEMAAQFGWWVARVSDKEWQINPPGLHTTITRYFETDEKGATMVLDEDDVTANLRAIRNAKAHSDIAIAHIHNHEWDQLQATTTVPPAFMPPFARSAVEAGADVVIAQGSHAPLRGIEIHKGKPIFYDTGDFFAMSNMVTRFPADFYRRHSSHLTKPMHDMTVSEVLDVRVPYLRDFPIHPPKPETPRRRCGVVPVLHYGDDGQLSRIELHPFVHEHDRVALNGIPMAPADEASARYVIDHLAELSRPFGTRIKFDGKIGLLDLSASS